VGPLVKGYFVVTPAIQFNPFTPQAIADPYPYFKVLRRDAPVYHIESANLWAISRYADNVFALRNPALFSSIAILEMLVGAYQPIPGDDGVTMISADPPEHTRLRRLVGTAFTPKVVSGLRQGIADFVEHAFDRVGTNEFDFVKEIALPLPLQTFFSLIGVPAPLRARAKELAAELHVASEVLSGSQVDPEWDARKKRAGQDIVDFIRNLVALRRAEPADDLISALVLASDEGNKLTEIEVFKMINLFFSTGTDSTHKLIANMLLSFLRNPEQYQKVRDDPALIPRAVKETLRYDGPALYMVRKVMEDVELAGTKLPKGARCLVMFGSANHDETQFPEPERFDVTRDATGALNNHLGFGHGIHRCVASNLGSLQAEVVCEKLIERYRDFSWDPARVVRDTSFGFRGLKQLPIVPVAA
jgi:cytochrome P450